MKWLSCSIIVKLITAVLLFAALGRHPYDYYTILRWVVSGVCAFTAFQASEKQMRGWQFMFIIVAIALNPIIPSHLKRETWNIMDVVIAVLLLISIGVLDFGKQKQ